MKHYEVLLLFPEHLGACCLESGGCNRKGIPSEPQDDNV